jgi:hypothetical protein
MFHSRTLKIFFALFLLLSIPGGVFLVLQQTHFFNRASGVSANLVIDAGNLTGAPGQNWRNLAQGGESQGRMLGGVIPKVTALHPKFIRIDHIYDNYNLVQKDGSGNLIFSWTELDQTVNDIRATGALPFFSLSYMPPGISKDGDVNSEPVNWADWETLVQKTIEHYSGRNNMNLSGVYYEVWNEPDLFGNYKIGGQKNYLDLYQHAAIGASRAGNVNSFKIGGPATSSLYQNWFDGILQFCQSNNIRLDFYSWHRYSKNLDDYDQDVANIKSWVAKYPNFQNIEFDVTETGINGANDPAYDTSFSAIQTIAASAVMEGNIDKSFTFEIVDGVGPQQFWGRWGILTNEKFGDPQIKPRYNALMFLNNMTGDSLGVTGQGSWVKAFAKKSGDTIKILVVNYDPNGSHQEAFPITVKNLPFNSFTVKRIDFSGGTSESMPVTGTNSWSATLGFTPNTASIFEIIKK